MYRKDTILTEVEKLVQALAKLMGLKTANQHEEAQKMYANMLTESYGLSATELPHLPDDDFKQLISQKRYSAGKLDVLAQLLYQDATTPFKHPSEAQSLLKKTLIIFDMLEREHHVQSFENISLRAKIQHLLQHA